MRHRDRVKAYVRFHVGAGILGEWPWTEAVDPSSGGGTLRLENFPGFTPLVRGDPGCCELTP